MKKTVLSAIFVLLGSVFVYAKDFNVNNQKIWSVDSDVIKQMRVLYMNTGHALPSASGPWSTDELKQMFEKIELSDSVPESIQSLYANVYNQLYANPRYVVDSSFGVNINYIFQPELYVHTNSADFTSADDWYVSYQNRADFFTLAFDFLCADNFYLQSAYPIGYVDSSTFYTPIFNTNILGLPPSNLSLMSINFPERAIFAFGGHNWSFSAGREKIRFGNGESGNLCVGGNLPYENHLRFFTYFDHFKYAFVANFYPHPVSKASTQDTPQDGLKFFMNHRLEGRFFKDKVDLIASESIMYQSATNSIDVTVFNPSGIFHNYYIRGNANSLLNIEGDWTIINGLNLYFQFAMDEAAAPGDTTAGSGVPYHPNKMGYMLGLKGSYPVGKGILNFVTEGVYTDPYMYARETYDPATKQYGVAFYGDNRYFVNSTSGNLTGGINYLNRCTGYIYGGNCITATVKTFYEVLNSWSCGAEGFLLIRGNSIKEFSDWITGANPVTPYCENGSVPEFSFRASCFGDYNILQNITAYGRIDNYFIWNKGLSASNMKYDFQTSLGVKIVL